MRTKEKIALYKIQNSEGLEGQVCDKLSKNYNILYLHNSVLVSPKTLEHNKKPSLTPKNKFFISEINSQTLRYENEFVQEWCRDEFVRLEKILFDKEQQAMLQAFSKVLDDIEIELAQEGGDGTGEHKKKQ